MNVCAHRLSLVLFSLDLNGGITGVNAGTQKLCGGIPVDPNKRDNFKRLFNFCRELRVFLETQFETHTECIRGRPKGIISV